MDNFDRDSLTFIIKIVVSVGLFMFLLTYGTYLYTVNVEEANIITITMQYYNNLSLIHI